MKNKKISFFIILIFLISCMSTVILSGKFNREQFSFLQPTVDITYPDNGAEITDQYIVVEGTAYDEMGLSYYQWTWEWSGGSQSGDQEIEPPTEYHEFQIDIGPLVFGENTVTVTFFNTEGASGSDSVTFFYMMDDNAPPEVVITYPQDGDEFNEPEVIKIGYYGDIALLYSKFIEKLMWVINNISGILKNSEKVKSQYLR